jgi:hypothetical protein
MKKLIPFAILSLLIFAASCGLKEQKKITTDQSTQFEDSIPHIIPSARSIHTMQNDDITKVTIVVGDPSFYTSDPAAKQQAAIRVGLMVLHVLGPDNNLNTGTFAVTKKDDNNDKLPADAITADMKIDSLKKILFPAK